MLCVVCFYLIKLEVVISSALVGSAVGASCAKIKIGVDVKTIIGSLIDRLAQFAVKSPDTIPTNIDIFDTFLVLVGNKDSYQIDKLMRGNRFLEAELHDRDRIISGRYVITCSSSLIAVPHAI